MSAVDSGTRLDLAAAAARGERANRPRGLVVLATAGFAAALIYLCVSIISKQSADARLASQQEAKARVSELAVRLRALEQRAAQPGGDRFEPYPQILTRIQGLATEVGVTGRVPNPTERLESLRQGDLIRKRFTVNGATNPELQPLLDWVARAKAVIPGLEVTSVKIKPLPNDWAVDVVFSRWERQR